MKILLLGDFSGLHSNLREGLRHLGHDVTLVSSGDGWKNLPRDVDIKKGNSKLKFIKSIQYRYNFLRAISSLSGYDVVQIINPNFFPRFLFPSKLIFKLLKKNNGKLFLSASGSDSYYWKHGRTRLKYSPHQDTLKYDSKSTKDSRESTAAYKFNKYLADTCDGIIPIMHEYEICYQGHENLKNVIPIPVNIKSIPYRPNTPNLKLSVFHGLNRYGFKGTYYIESAFRELSKKYDRNVEFIIDGKMPLDKYLELIQSTNIVVDQALSHSWGVNAVYAMAMGKVVLSGCEQESLNSFKLDTSPVINIKPSQNHIVEVLERLITDTSLINDIGLESRQFALEFHDHIKVSQQYLETWSNS